MTDARIPHQLLFALTLAGGLFACADPPRDADIVIRNATLLIGDGTVIDGGTIAVDDGRIISVGRDVGLWKATDDIDADGMAVLPGLTDGHVHLLALVSDSSESVRRYREESLPALLAGFLEAGITTIRSTGDPLVILEVREQLRVGDLQGPRLLASGPVLCAVEGHPAGTVCGMFENPEWCRKNLTRELPDEGAAREAVAELADAGVDFIKLVHDNWSGPKLDFQILAAVIEEAHERGLKVLVHGTPGDLAIEAIEAGADGLVHVPWGEVDVERLVQTAGQRPVSTTVGLLRPFSDEDGNLRTPYGEWNEQREELRDNLLNATTELWNNDSPLLFGTDTPMFQPLESWRHEVGGLLEAGFEPMDVVLMATRNAASALDLEDELGTLETGKRADIILVSGQPHVDLNTLENIVLVVKDGVVVVDRR